MRNVFKGISLIFLPAVIWVFVNATINRHTHHMPDGFYVSHAHPFNKTSSDPDSDRSHQHSKTEILLLSFFSDPVTTVILSFFFSVFLYAFTLAPKRTQNYSEDLRKYYQVLNYHGPPGQ